MKKIKFQGVLLGLLLLPLGSPANPTGGSVAAGSAGIAGQGTGAVTVRQTSSTAIINWQTFSIGAGELTTFLQPSAQSAVLNRVLGGQTSLIDGTLSANGQVYLVNGNGIVVGPGGVVNANAFTASTRDIANADFLAGKLHFTGSGDAGVQNFGTISALGGDVVLIGKTVDNEGSISAPNGTAGLVAGDDVLLAQKNADGSTIQVTASASASGANGQTGVRNGGTIAAAAAELKAANGNIYALAIQNQGTIRAATVKKQGGHIWLLSETGTVVNSGTLDASPTAAGGKGGAIETSGASVGVSGTVTAGRGGTWLIDPLAPVTLDNGASPFPDVNVTTLGDTLTAGTSTTITANGNTTNNGDIYVVNDVTWTGDASLTLSAKGNIHVDANITSDLGDVNLVADNTGSGAGTVDFNGGALASTAGKVNIFYNPSNPGGTTAGTINATEYTTPNDYSGDVAGGATLNAYMLVNNVDDLQNIENNLSGSYAQVKNIDASVTANWNPSVVNNFTVNLGFTPVGGNSVPFTGNYNGNGFTISKLTIDLSTLGQVGLFGVNAGSVENLALVNASVIGLQNVGALAGSNADGTITNCSATGTVTGVDESAGIGGLVGYNYGTVDSSTASATVFGGTGATAVGGLVGVNGLHFNGLGYDYGTVQHSNATGLVSAAGGSSQVGGLVGDNVGTVDTSFATGPVFGANDVGGLVGTNEGGLVDLVENSYATGQVNAGDNASAIGGLVGENDGTVQASYATGLVITGTNSYAVGGLVGDNFGNGVLQTSYSVGSVVTGTNGYAIGGLVGLNEGGDLIEQCYSRDSVGVGSGSTYIGGLVGFNDLSTIEESYSTGNINASGSTFFGAFVGDNLGTITDCFWDTTTSGITSPGIGTGTLTGVTGATTTQLTSPSFIAANSSAGTWNFTPGTGSWGIDAYTNNGVNSKVLINTGLPILAWQYPLVAVTAANQNVTYTGQSATLPNPNDYTVTGNPSLLLATPSLSIISNAVNAGTYTITANAVPQVGDAVELLNGTLTINKAPLTVTANSGAITYKGTGFSGGEGVTYSGFVNNQGPGVLGGGVSYSGDSQGATNVGDYTITPGGLISTNYAITYVPGTLTINPATLTVTAGSPTITYNGQAFNSPSVTYVGLKGSDTPASVLSGSLNFTGTGIGAMNVGTYTIVPGGLSLTSNNYTLAYADGTLTINPAVLTVTVKAGTSIYGQNVATAFPVPGLSITGLVGNDTAASIGYSSLITGTGNGITSTTDAGKYSVTIGGGLTDNNYVLKPGIVSPVGKTTTWTVTPDVLTVSGLTGTSIYGQTPPTPATGYTLASSNGVTDQATLLALLSGAPVTTPYVFGITDTTNAGKYNTDQITLAPTLANGVNTHDYTLKIVKQGVWTVTPDLITIAGLTNGSSTYGFATGFDGTSYFDITDEDNTVNIDDLIAGAKATLAATAVSNAGTYAVGVTGKLAPGVSTTNYKIVLQKGTWTITPQAVNIAIHDGTSVYGSKPGVPVLTSIGMVNGKAVTLGALQLKGYSTDLLNVIGAKSQAGAGLYTIDLTGAGTGNYVAANPNVTATWTVAPATITSITIARGAKSVYGSDPVNAELKVTGLVNGDKPDVLGYTLAGNGGPLTATTDASATPYTFIVGGGLTDPNYVLKVGLSPPLNLPGSITITPAPLTVTALSGTSAFGTDPTYGNADGDFGYGVTGFVNGDTINSTGILTGFTETPLISNATAAGTYTIVVTKPPVLADTNYTVKVVNGKWIVTP